MHLMASKGWKKEDDVNQLLIDEYGFFAF